uniref:Neurotransmitter-gated ion-channel ligand-binding domain-containing protein n=1 Tax=Acrobeloides nanus TaxID=290746 RepID=A0A914CJA8_9BILA
MEHYSFSVSILLWFLLRLSNGAKVERDLYELLLNDYNATIRPVQNARENVTVYMGLSLQQIIDVNEKDQEVELNAWLKFNWTDPQLRWNPEEFDGITDLRFKKDQLWTPDILLYNSVAEDFNTIFPTNLVVYYNGIVNWIPPGVFQLSCRIDVTWFPFDEQVCFMKFGSWTYHSQKVDLRFATENDFDLSTYMENGEWTIKGILFPYIYIVEIFLG